MPLPLLVLSAACAAVALRPRRFRLRDRVVVVTGGSRGLGLALARQCGRQGARLHLLARSADQLQRAGALLRSEGITTDVHICDVTDAGACARVVGEIVAREGIDVLINNAGIITSSPAEHVQDVDFERSLATHFWGPLHLIRAVLPHMRERRAGHIVNISSVGGRVAVPHLLAYSVGKFALSALSDGLRSELAKDGIIVTTATPGLMRTGSHRNVEVRGRHAREAQWFATVATTPLTAMDADRAAGAIVGAMRDGRARVAPGARAIEITAALLPELTAAAMAFAVAAILPGPTDAAGGDQARRSRDLSLGWLARALPSRDQRRHNQTLAPDQRSQGTGPP